MQISRNDEALVVKGNKGGTDSTNAQLPFGVFVDKIQKAMIKIGP